jgi:hypothetical protein
VLLGARDELSRDRAEDFFLTGTIHLLAISGLHIGILACGLWWLLRLLAVERRWSLLAAAVLVVAYAALTEARPPVIRARSWWSSSAPRVCPAARIDLQHPGRRGAAAVVVESHGPVPSRSAVVVFGGGDDRRFRTAAGSTRGRRSPAASDRPIAALALAGCRGFCWAEWGIGSPSRR